MSTRNWSLEGPVPLPVALPGRSRLQTCIMPYA